jgi:hypothetical protein
MLMLLGTWGGLASFIAPYADFGFEPANDPWIWTDARGWLEVIPAVAVVLGGLILLSSANRTAGAFGAWLAALGGAWFVVGNTVMTFFDGPVVGAPIGSPDRQAAEQLAFFSGLGVVIVYFAALALGRLSVVGVRDVKLAEREAADQAATRPTPYTPEHGGHEPMAEAEPERDREPVGRYSLRKREQPPADRHVAGASNTRPDL